MSLEELEETLNEPPLSEAPNRRKPERRRIRRRRIGVLILVLLLALISFLNGPGFRMIGTYAATKAAASRGLAGSLRLEGSLWSGFSIRDLEFRADESSGTKPAPDKPAVLSVRLGELSLSYRALGLITGAAELDWLDFIKIDSLDLVLRLPEATGEKEKPRKEKAPAPARETFHPAWNLLATEIRIDRISARIEQGENTYGISGFGLTSLPDADGELILESVTLPGNDPVENLSLGLRKEERSLSLGPLPIEPYGTLRSLTVAEPTPNVFTLGLEAVVAGGELTVSFDENQNFAASLREGTQVDLATLFPDRREEMPLHGTVDVLDLTFVNPSGKPSQWKVAGNISASGLGWDAYTVDQTRIRVENHAIQLELKRPDASVNAVVSLPLDRAETVGALSQLPIDLAASVSVPSLEVLAANLEKELPVSGSLSLDARNFQADMEGNLNAGNLLLQTDNLTWDGLSIPTVQLAAIVENPNLLKLAADLGLDPKTHARVLANFDRNTMAYTGEANLRFESGGALSEWLSSTKELELSGNSSLAWKGSGDLQENAHRGTVGLTVGELVIGSMKPVEASLAMNYGESSFALSQAEASAGRISIGGKADWDGKTISLHDWTVRESTGDAASEVLSLSAAIPFDRGFEGGFLEQPGPVRFDLGFTAFDPAAVLELFDEDPNLHGQLDGTLAVGGTFGKIDAEGDFSLLPRLDSVQGDSRVDLDLGFSGNVSVPGTWSALIDAELSGLQYKGVELGTADLELKTDSSSGGNRLRGELSFAHEENRIDAQLEADLSQADTLGSLASLPVGLDASIAVKSLGGLLRDFAPPRVAGLPVDGSIDLKLENVRLREKSLSSGTFSLQSDTLSFEGQSFEKLAIDAHVDRPDHLVASLAVALDPESQAAGAGQYHLKEQTYSGELGLKADLKGEGKLRNLLSSRNIAKLLPGTTSLEWKGNGEIREGKHSGDLDLSAKTLHLADGATPMNLNLAGSYSESSADFPGFSLESDVLDLSGSLLWRDGLLNLSEWVGTSSGNRVIDLNASIPLDREALGLTWFDQKETVEVDLAVSNLGVATISRLFLKEAPVRASLDFDLSAKGLPSRLSLDGDLALRDILLPNENGNMDLGELDLALQAVDGKASVKGGYRHPDLNPLSLEAAIPFFPAEWAKGERQVAEESLSVKAQMERSSLAFLAAEVPAIESIDGTVGIHAALSGTIAKPSISGDGVLEVTRLRLDNRDAPSLYDIDLSTRFSDNRVTIDRLRAIVAGGVVEGSGSVLLDPAGEPTFDLRVTGDEVLVYRTPDLSLRTDADISLTGPFSAARLAGEVGITNSRFFKNFDLLPTALPTRSTSVLPTVEKGPSGGGAAYTDLDFGVKQEPFRNWTADVRIHTKDPFLIRSNLVESDLVADLRIGGNLGRPVPVGYLAINEGEMSLPFSSVDVETGRIKFDETTGFNGALEFKAQAKADKYRINVYLYNRVLDPKYVLTSVPPMPSEDLITLLVTGTSRQDLVGEGAGSKAAGKAATLLFKNFRKASAEADREPTLLDDLQERTELDIGGVNPETGEHTVGGKIRLWKQLFFVGDVDARNDYRAVLKYVFRFR